MAKPETLPILNGVLDYRRQITNPYTDEVIKTWLQCDSDN